MREPDGIRVTIPDGAGLVPYGWYMMFVTGDDGTLSTACWVRVD